MNINHFYFYDVLEGIAYVQPEMNNRTGVPVRALPGITYQTDLQNGFPLLGLRKIPFSFVPEIMWFLSGSKDTEWLSKHTKIWDFFKEEDGTVTSAYGWRWRKAFGPDQLEEVLNKLKADQSNRHGVVMSWDPAVDLTVKQKNVPCPVMFTVNIIRGRLNLHLVVRSNDMVLGFPTDVAGFALLQHILAQELGIQVGTYTHSISNAHIYKNQMPAIEEMRKREYHLPAVFLKLPKDCYRRAKQLDDSLVAELKAAFTGYEPHSAIIGIPIAI